MKVRKPRKDLERNLVRKNRSYKNVQVKVNIVIIKRSVVRVVTVSSLIYQIGLSSHTPYVTNLT